MTEPEGSVAANFQAESALGQLNDARIKKEYIYIYIYIYR
jgi:hypothetical protein